MSVEITKFGDVPKAVQEGNDKALLILVTNVTNKAKTAAPVHLGQLRNSIMGRVEKRDTGFNSGGRKQAPSEITPKAKQGEGYVGSNVLHAIYNEFGTRKMAAQPFLRPAIAAEASGADVKAAVKKYQLEAIAQGMAKTRNVTRKLK